MTTHPSSSPLDERNERTARAYLRAYADKNLDALAALLSPNVRLRDWNLAVEGKDAVCAETLNNFNAAQTLAIDVQRIFVSHAHVAAELHIVVNGDVSLAVVDVFGFDDDGRINAIRAYKG